MLLWIVIIVLTGAAILAVLLPLGRSPGRSAGAEARAVYLQQLDEIDRDKADGRLSPDQAAIARAELARRLIAMERDDKGEPLGTGSATARRSVAFAALLGIPIVSLGIYLSLGAPQIPGAPLAARMSPAEGDQQIDQLIARVEEHLGREPEDWRGWEVLAPVYLRIGRAADAATAYRNAIRIDGATAERQSGLGEALVARSGGVVTAEARQAFEGARAADPDAVTPRFYLALAKRQEGDVDAAAADLKALLAEAPADAPWRNAIEQAITDIDGNPVSVEPGPSAEDVAAAADMDPAARQEMIENMVAGLATRLRDEPGDTEGWLRLVRAYTVMGRHDDARNAAETALRSISEPDGRDRIAALASDLGLELTGAATP